MELYKVIRRIKRWKIKRYRQYLPFSEIKKHVYISWKSGSGKSELMKTLFFLIQLKTESKRNKSLILIDPHWDLTNDVKNFYLNKDSDRIVYIDPYLKNWYTPTLNPFQLYNNNEYNIELTSQFLVKAFQELVPKSILSNQMSALLMPCITTLLRKKWSSLCDLQTFMNDDLNSSLVELWKQSPNPSHRHFFTSEFQHSIYRNTKASLYSKIQSLLNSQTFYNLVIGENTLNLEEIINSGKLILFNLSKGKMWVEASEAFWRLMLSTIQSIAQKRARMPRRKRKDTFLFVDEFHNYITPSIETILKETRKFSLFLILANQTLEDIKPAGLLSNLLNNTEVKAVGRNGSGTLSKLSREINIKTNELQKMLKFQFYIKAWDKKARLIKTNTILKSNYFRLNVQSGQADRQSGACWPPLNEVKATLFLVYPKRQFSVKI